MPVTSIQPEKETIDLKVGDTYAINPVISPENATLDGCRITNSKDYVASVAEDGKVTAKYPGITVVSISSLADAGVSCRFRIRVTDEFAPEEGFDKNDETISHGEVDGFYYPSDYRSGGQAHALIWYPPNYDAGKQYNLLFCLHGGNDNEYYWTNDKPGANDGCSANYVCRAF